MYILPILTHLEVVALGGRSDISPDQHLNYASNHGLLSDVARRRDRRLGRPDLIHFGRGHRYRTSARRVCRDADLELHRCSLALYPRSVCLGHHCLIGLFSQPELATEELTSTGTFPRL